jgi:penicillin-binding protein 2
MRYTEQRMTTLDRKSEKITIIMYLVIAVFLFILMRMWQLQILQGDEYLKLSEANRLRIINVPAPRGIIFDRNGTPLVKNSPFYTASLIAEEFDRAMADDLSGMLDVPANEIVKKINRHDISPFVPVKIKQDLTFEEVAYIEARRSDFPGLLIETEVSREYIYGNIGAHLIGYLGKMSPAQSKDPAMKGIPLDTFIGQWGVERLLDDSLRGTPGERIIEVNALGRELRLLQENPPVKGKDVMLSMDINLQKEAEISFGDRAGALVALQPATGEILGMVSKPSFDPNLFTRGIDFESWEALTKDTKNPLLNRALQSQYPPGSTFKIVTAIAGLEEGVITPETEVNCRGAIYYGKWRFGCWRSQGHGTVSLHRAIVESCDVYFYKVGKRLGIDKIHDYAVRLGLGKKTGIELGIEREGLIPSTEWKREKKKSQWFLGETFNSAIGQGYVSLTPLQLTVMMGSIVNGGVLYKPLLTKGANPVPVGQVQISPDTVQLIKNGLRGVVNEPRGTGGASRSEIVQVAGKTGTAQVVALRSGLSGSERYRDHAWFVAFAPFEQPEVALSVFVEHGGHGGSAAAPIAKRALEAYFSPPQEEIRREPRESGTDADMHE